ncbi:MAG TPA: PqiC family protein [Opitutaceae bacterium]|nr:PqiC family protein [Opitutaceae bacterium]
MNTNDDGKRARVGFGLLACAATLALGGCSLPLPQAESDPTRYYLLAATSAGTPSTEAANAPAIHLRPVELANYIRSRPMIVRRGENEVEFRDYARWGEPLEQGIARVLREELLARGAASAVQTTGARAAMAGYDFELSVRVLASEGAANGAVDFRARWELTTVSDKERVVASGDFRPKDLRWDPKNDATLAAALSKAVGGLAAEIAAGLPKK